MEAPPPKKQKKAPSVAGDVAAAVPASGWASLTTELIGTLSKFLACHMRTCLPRGLLMLMATCSMS